MATIMEILRLPVEQRKSLYGVSSNDKKIHEVEIDGQIFTGYKAFSFMREKTYHSEPGRSLDGSINNLNSHTSFVTPRLKIDFSLMSIDDYRRLITLIHSKNEFRVTCYDPVYNRRTTNNMYFAPDELPKLVLLQRAIAGEEWVELLGVEGFVVEMIGTNSKLDQVSIAYLQLNPATNELITSITKDYYSGQEIIVGDEIDFKQNVIEYDGETYYPTGKWQQVYIDVSGWQTKGSWLEDNRAMSIYKDYYVAMVYEKSTETKFFNVYLNYGLGEEKLDNYDNPIYSISMPYGGVFNLTDYTTEVIEVDFFGSNFEPYKFEGWYYTPKKVAGSTQLDGTKFEKTQDVTIYQLYTPNEYELNLDLNYEGSETQIGSITAPYGTRVAIPIPKRDGFNFVGWYYEKNCQNKFDGTIPPYHWTIYAKWEQEE